MFVVNAVDRMLIAVIPIDQPPSVEFATYFEIHDYYFTSSSSYWPSNGIHSLSKIVDSTHRMINPFISN